MKNKQDGFGLVEFLVILLVVSLLGFGGWYVWNSKKNNYKSSSSNTQLAEDISKENPKAENHTYEGWKTYTNATPAFSFKYPGDWSVEKEESSNTYVRIKVASTDYDEQETELCLDIKSGYKITVGYNSKFADPDVVSKKLSEEPPFVKDAEKITMGGQEAVRYSETPGECGYSEITATYFDGYEVSVSSFLGEELGAYEDEYNKIVESFKF